MNFIKDYIMVRVFSQAKVLLQRCSYGIRKIFKIYMGASEYIFEWTPLLPANSL